MDRLAASAVVHRLDSDPDDAGLDIVAPASAARGESRSLFAQSSAELSDLDCEAFSEEVGSEASRDQEPEFAPQSRRAARQRREKDSRSQRGEREEAPPRRGKGRTSRDREEARSSRRRVDRSPSKHKKWSRPSQPRGKVRNSRHGSSAEPQTRSRSRGEKRGRSDSSSCKICTVCGKPIEKGDEYRGLYKRHEWCALDFRADQQALTRYPEVSIV